LILGGGVLVVPTKDRLVIAGPSTTIPNHQPISKRSAKYADEASRLEEAPVMSETKRLELVPIPVR
jgi:hypothetical protein